MLPNSGVTQFGYRQRFSRVSGAESALPPCARSAFRIMQVPRWGWLCQGATPEVDRRFHGSLDWRSLCGISITLSTVQVVLGQSHEPFLSNHRQTPELFNQRSGVVQCHVTYLTHPPLPSNIDKPAFGNVDSHLSWIVVSFQDFPSSEPLVSPITS